MGGRSDYILEHALRVTLLELGFEDAHRVGGAEPCEQVPHFDLAHLPLSMTPKVVAPDLRFLSGAVKKRGNEPSVPFLGLSNELDQNPLRDILEGC